MYIFNQENFLRISGSFEVLWISCTSMQYRWTLVTSEEPSALKERTYMILGCTKEYSFLEIFNFSAYFLDSSSGDILFSGVLFVEVSVSSGDVEVLLRAFSAL